MSDVGKLQGWRVHAFVRLPLHNNACRICQEYHDHTTGMDTESAEKVAQDMARVWAKERGRGSRDGEKIYGEEGQDDPGEIERVKRQPEESKRSAENEIESLRRQLEESKIWKRAAESEIESLKQHVEELKKLGEGRTAMLSIGAFDQRNRLSSPRPIMEHQTKASRALKEAGIITQDNPGTLSFDLNPMN